MNLLGQFGWFLYLVAHFTEYSFDLNRFSFAILHYFIYFNEKYSIVYMYHIFIRSSVNGHLGSIHVLTVVNSAAVNTGVCISFQIMFFPGHMPRWDCRTILVF